MEELSSSGLDQVAWYGVPLPGGEIEDLLDKLPSKPHPAEVQTLSPAETAAWLSLLAPQSLNHGTARGISRDEAGWLCRTIEVALNDLSPVQSFWRLGHGRFREG